MSKFLDLLNSPLPSLFNESDDFSDEDEKAIAIASSIVDDEDDEDEDDVDDKDDDDDDDDDDCDDCDDEDNEVELSPEENAEADSIINLAATPIVLKEELTPAEIKEFAESSEYAIAVDEGFVFEDAEDTFAATSNDLFVSYEAAKFYNKNVVRFTKQARTNQLFEVCVLACARAKKDPQYIKLAKIQKIRRKLKAILRVRYKAPAMKKAKEYIIRLRQSRSPILSKAADALTK